MHPFIDVTTLSMGNRGEAIAEHGGERLFVPFGLPGERVRVSVDDSRASIEAIIDASPDRVAPFCPHFTRCGGCQLQHWSEAPYRAWKRGLLVDALARGGVTADVGDLVDAHGSGRRRATFHTTQDGAGFAGWRSHRIETIATCPVLAPAMANAPAIAADIGRVLAGSDVAITATETGLDVAIRTKSRARPDLSPLARRHDLARLLLNGEIAALRRQPRLSFGDVVADLPAESFLQPTAEGEAALAELVLAGIGPARKVADLFCGVGPFALRIARQAQMFAADNNRAAVAALDAALQATPGLKRMGTEVRDLFKDPFVPQELARFDAVVFDPPRAGAKAQAEALARSKVKRIVAVSCDPASFARDAAILIEGGYRLTKATPVDQFRYTAHLETVGVFRR